MNNFLFALWFFLPAGCANMAPVLANKIPLVQRFTYPLDGYKKWRGKRILGDHKTVRGLLSGLVLAIFVAWLQTLLYQHNSLIHSLVPSWFGQVNPIVFGGLSGFGALAGDGIKSFFKRQLGVVAGKSWFPFDQTDYILGGIIATALVYRLSVMEYIYILFVYFCLHLLVSAVGYVLHLKEAVI